MTQGTLAVIDCSKITGPLEDVQHTEAFKKFTKELGDGMSGIGFVYFVNHELASKTVETLLEKSQQFFELPKEIKRKYRKVDAVENFHGYSGAGDESLNKEQANDPLQDIKESFDFYGPDGMDESKYPIEVPGFKAAADAFKESLKDLSKKIFRAFAVYLELEDPDYFIRRHCALDDPSIQCHTDYRSTYYMALGSDIEIGPESMRLGAHNDWGTVTFLCQDEAGGLEAKNTDGTWIPVTPIPNSVVLNAGLMLEMWSGGHFPATAHRVRLLKEKAGTPRQSLAYFIQPDGNCNCVPVVAEKENWKPLYPKVDKETHFEYFKERVRGSRPY